MSGHRIIPIYSSRGEVEAFLVFPYLFNKSGEWIGWVTPQREVYSVRGAYVGALTNDPRIVRNQAISESTSTSWAPQHARLPSTSTVDERPHSQPCRCTL